MDCTLIARPFLKGNLGNMSPCPHRGQGYPLRISCGRMEDVLDLVSAIGPVS